MRGRFFAHPDGAGGTDADALAAAHALTRFQGRAGAHQAAHGPARQRSEGAGGWGGVNSRELRSATSLKSGTANSSPGDGKGLRVLGDITAPVSGSEGGHVLRSQADDVGGGEIEGVRALRGQHRADLARRARRGAVALHGDDGVADREAGTDEIGKVDEQSRQNRPGLGSGSDIPVSRCLG